MAINKISVVSSIISFICMVKNSAKSLNQPKKKGVFDLTHIIPMEYWLTSRILGGYYVAFFHRVGWQFILLMIFGGKHQDVIGFIIAWMSFKSVYELGYIMNDFWSERRENTERGNYNSIPAISIHQGLLLVIPRIVFSFCLGILLYFVTNNWYQVYFSYLIITTSFACFLLHNLTKPKYRSITYLCLHVLKGALVIPFLPNHDLAMSFPILACVIIPALPATIGYLVHKGNLRPSWWSKNYNMGVTQMRLCVLLLIVSFSINWVFRGKLETIFIWLIIYYIGFIWLISLVTFAKATRRSVKQHEILQHVHSNYSHDGMVQLEIIVELATKMRFKKCFMTEHAEDFDYNRFEGYKEEVIKINQHHTSENCALVPGLEFPILKQHILAFSLKKFVSIDGTRAQSIDALREQASTVIWAHPMLATRRLWRLSYIIELLQIARRVDGIEWASGKSDRARWYFAWRHFVVAFLVHHLWPQKTLVFGYDLHAKKDWEALSLRLGE